KGFLFKDREFQKILDAGIHWFVDPLNKTRVDVVSMRDPWLYHEDLDMLVKESALADDLVVLDLKDYERALVWIDNRFARVLGPGLYALWKTHRDIRWEIVDAGEVRFEHADMHVIRKAVGAVEQLDISFVEQGCLGVLFKDGKYVDAFKPGQYMFWKNVGKVKFFHVDMRESIMDVSGQEIMTADKVTLRLNAMVAYRVVDALKFITACEDSRQALYREAQLALRAVVGTFELDKLLGDKEAVAAELATMIRGRAEAFGLEVIDLGVRDIILPGDMKELMNKVIEARKAADANLIVRREETAAMRSQANTARLLENNPTLMRLRELDVLEKIAVTSKLNVVLGEKGLADRVVNLL
ncbi:MAG: slipin family protein, partial [Desulfobacterales bacterium]|nr:slipin family protein [Desulfobacterales bacterium]